MTKADLIEEVVRVSNVSKKHAEVIVNTVFSSIVEALQRDDKIELRGFGSFRVRKRRSRQGRNPKTGDHVEVPEKRIPYFKPGKELKDLINEDGEDGEDGQDGQDGEDARDDASSSAPQAPQPGPLGDPAPGDS